MAAPAVQSDKMQRPHPDVVKLTGLLGERFELSRVNRLHHQEEDYLLFPFRFLYPVDLDNPKRPWPEIRGDWQGEFMGTWLDAAVLTAWNKEDNKLREKITRMVKEWLATQGEDGYLGTCDDDYRWKLWDIWIHAHDIIGLISYYKYTGDKEALNAAIRAANCVLDLFGPGKRFVHPTGPHKGMASSAILEPLIWLYFETGENRYLEWGKWLVDVDWEAPEGPHTLSILLNNGNVADVGGGKGIEMLTNFAGLVELYRATGEDRYLTAVVNAWEDITQHQLYITGTSSTGELFSHNYLLRNDGIYLIGETCVSMGWVYLNFSLGRLTGNARYFDMAEMTVYNHLLGAQSPDGKGWVYYLGLRDHKRYRWHTSPECCPSRGVRAVAQFPQHVYTVDSEGILVNLYDASTSRMTLKNGMEVALKMDTGYPFDGGVKLQITPTDTSEFAIKLRLPGWCNAFVVQVNDEVQDVKANDQGYLVMSRKWKANDTIVLTMEMPVRVVVDHIGNPGHVALTRGPLVYAADHAYLEDGRLLDDIILCLDPTNASNSIQTIKDDTTGHIHLIVPAVLQQGSTGAQLWREDGRYYDITPDDTLKNMEIRFVPFFDAGNREPECYRDGVWQAGWTGTDTQRQVVFQVWLPYIWANK